MVVFLTTSNPQRRPSAVVTNDQDAHAFFYNTKEKMKWKSFQVYAANVTVSNGISLRRHGGFMEEQFQLCIELFGELWFAEATS